MQNTAQARNLNSRSTENEELGTHTKHSLISRAHLYIYISKYIYKTSNTIYIYVCMKDKGAEFPKKPCVQIHTKSLCAAVNDAKSRRAPRLPSGRPQPSREEESRDVRTGISDPGEAAVTQLRVSSCKRSSEKNHPYSTCAGACTREPLFQRHLQGASLYPSFFHIEKEPGSCYLLPKRPTPA